MEWRTRIPFLGDERKQAESRSLAALLRTGGEDPQFVEQFRALRSKIEYKADMLQFKVLAVTSAIAGEGKTMATANTAMNLASGGRKKVLLVDVDLRKADLARGLELSPLPGLSEYLSGSVAFEEIVRRSVVPGLDVVPAGTRVPGPADMLSGARFRAFLERARAEFDIVILDTPPVLPVADTLAFREQVDKFLFIFRVGFTPHAMLKQAIEEIDEKRVLGVVLNGVEPHTQRYYASYYGGYYVKGGKTARSGESGDRGTAE